MADDVRLILERAAGAPRRELEMKQLRAKARNSKMMRVTGLVVAISTVIAGSAAVAVRTTNSDARPAPAASPSEPAEDPKPQELQWPEPYEPRTTVMGGRTMMLVIFPDKTAANLSYPSDLHLAERGLQPAISYSFKRRGLNSRQDIIFIHGDTPPGLVDPEPLDALGGTPFPAELHALTYKRRRDDPPYALLFKAHPWTILATVQQREDVETLANHLHPSVTEDGWPSIFATGPLQLSEGFGEAGGAHIEVGDWNPLSDITDTRGDPINIIMGPVASCRAADEGVSEFSDYWYGSKCLEFTGGELGIFLSIYGPERFVRSAYEGIRLEE